MSTRKVSDLQGLAAEGVIKSSAMTYKVIYLEECASVVKEAKEAVKSGASEGTVVVADEVLGAPKGILWFTLILRPPLHTPVKALLGQAMALSLSKALRSISGVEARIRWPHDIVYGERVLGTIEALPLEESYASPLPLLLNVRVNINNEEEISGTVDEVSIKKLVGADVSRAELLTTTLKIFDDLYRKILNHEYRVVTAEVRRLSETIGRYIRAVTRSEGLVEGLAVDIDYDGSLVIDVSGGFLVHIYEDDVYRISEDRH